MTTEATFPEVARLALRGEAGRSATGATTLREIVTQVRDFIDANRPRFTSRPAGWVDHWEKSLAFHATRGNLALVWQPTPNLVGVAIAWRLHEAEIWQAEHSGRSVFEWRGNNPQGDAVYLALVCTLPSPPRSGRGIEGEVSKVSPVRVLARYYLDRWPEWAGLKQFCHRRGQLRREDGLLNRLAGLPKPST